MLSRGNERLVLVARAEIGDNLLHQGVDRAIGIVAGLGLLVLVAAILAADRLARRITAPLLELAPSPTACGRARSIPGCPGGPAGGRRRGGRAEPASGAGPAAARERAGRRRGYLAPPAYSGDRPEARHGVVEDPDVAERLRGHVTQLERTVDAIVHDARRPSRSTQMATPSCDVGRVVGERVAFWSALAEDQGRPLRLALPDRPLRARLDAADLADVVDVLIDNVFADTDDGVAVGIVVHGGTERSCSPSRTPDRDCRRSTSSTGAARTPAPPDWGWTSSGVPRWQAGAASSSAARGWAGPWSGSSRPCRRLRRDCRRRAEACATGAAPWALTPHEQRLRGASPSRGEDAEVTRATSRTRLTPQARDRAVRRMTVATGLVSVTAVVATGVAAAAAARETEQRAAKQAQRTAPRQPPRRLRRC